MYASLPELTWGLLHADPESEAFLRQPDTGAVGLIDWTATTNGPVLYDVASALMYLGGRRNAGAFWDAYVSHSPAPVGRHPVVMTGTGEFICAPPARQRA
jgi:Ser/Thr protein kinase RdoA (MazF antagonist)